MDGLLDIDGLAAFLGVKRTWVRDKVTARAIPHRRIGRHVRFAPEDVDRIVSDAFRPVQRAPTRDEVIARKAKESGVPATRKAPHLIPGQFATGG